MKKFLALLILAFMLCSILALSSCDYQDSIDSTMDNLKDTSKDLLDPFLNKSEGESSTNSQGSSDNGANQQ